MLGLKYIDNSMKWTWFFCPVKELEQWFGTKRIIVCDLNTLRVIEAFIIHLSVWFLKWLKKKLNHNLYSVLQIVKIIVVFLVRIDEAVSLSKIGKCRKIWMYKNQIVICHIHPKNFNSFI